MLQDTVVLQNDAQAWHKRLEINIISRVCVAHAENTYVRADREFLRTGNLVFPSGEASLLLLVCACKIAGARHYK